MISQITGRSPQAGQGHKALLLAVALFVFLLIIPSPVSYANSDPYLSLLVSQSLLEHGQLKLDAYRDTVDPPLDSYGSDGMIYRDGDHYYYYPPIGPSLFVLPFVAAANGLGWDMGVPAHNYLVQRILSALMVVALFLCAYQISVCYLQRSRALALAAFSVLGSSLISTVGTALWNLNFSALAVSLSLLLLVHQRTGRSRHAHPFLLGFLLFAAYISRPTAAIFIGLVLLYLLVWQRDAFWKTAVTAGLLLAIFVLASWLEYGRWLPPYYDVGGRVLAHSERTSLWLVLYGQTFSPSRGLFAFSPFFLLVLLLAARYLRHLARRPFFWLGLLWLGLHLLVISRTTRWWGGHSYGPRLFTDALPAFVLIGALLWHEVEPRLSRRGRWVLAAFSLALALWGIFVHAVQGLYNLNTLYWNGQIPPNVDGHQAYLFDWRYPQFLATNKVICARNRDFMWQQLRQDPAGLHPYRPSEPIAHDGSGGQAAFIGWDHAGARFRWSFCPSAAIVFRLEAVEQKPYVVSIVSGALRSQEVSVWLNGHLAGEATFSGLPVAEMPPPVVFPLDPAWLRPNALNEIVFEIPQASMPTRENRNLRDQRRLGMALVSLRIDTMQMRSTPR